MPAWRRRRPGNVCASSAERGGARCVSRTRRARRRAVPRLRARRRRRGGSTSRRRSATRSLPVFPGAGGAGTRRTAGVSADHAESAPARVPWPDPLYEGHGAVGRAPSSGARAPAAACRDPTAAGRFARRSIARAAAVSRRIIFNLLRSDVLRGWRVRMDAPPAFVDLSDVYDRELSKLAGRAAGVGIASFGAVYAAIPGPLFRDAAEAASSAGTTGCGRGRCVVPRRSGRGAVTGGSSDSSSVANAVGQASDDAGRRGDRTEPRRDRRRSPRCCRSSRSSRSRTGGGADPGSD